MPTELNPPRPDVRLATAGMTAVDCASCGAHVTARKASWEQTSVQWDADALATCWERRATRRGAGPNGGVFTGCQALRESLRTAAVAGALPVLDESEARTNPLHGTDPEAGLSPGGWLTA